MLFPFPIFSRHFLGDFLNPSVDNGQSLAGKSKGHKVTFSQRSDDSEDDVNNTNEVVNLATEV
jgi:hypothetical protein